MEVLETFCTAAQTRVRQLLETSRTVCLGSVNEIVHITLTTVAEGLFAFTVTIFAHET